MVKLDFHSDCVALIMDCVQTTKFSILFNETPTGCFCPKRGLRQSDPLSPYLFLLCWEALSSLIIGVQLQKCITGLRPGNNCPGITHLFFVDDNLIFCKV